MESMLYMIEMAGLCHATLMIGTAILLCVLLYNCDLYMEQVEQSIAKLSSKIDELEAENECLRNILKTAQSELSVSLRNMADVTLKRGSEFLRDTD